MATNALNKCPECESVGMTYNAANGTYYCPACELTFSRAQIEGAAQQTDIAAYVSEAIRSIDSPESAVLYLETFFEGYDWETYNNEADLDIADLRIMVEKNKIKNPGNPKSWQLEAESIIVPLQHKLEALVALQETIADNYHGDIADVADEMSSYNVVADAIVDNREKLIKTLNQDIANMERFGTDAETIANAREQVAAMEAALAEIVTAEEVEALPVVQKRMAANEAAEIAKYSAKGINAVECYEHGKTAFKANHFTDAIAYFAQIKTFRDSAKYINVMNSVFTFGEIIEAGGKTFKVAAHKAVIDLSNKSKGCGSKKKNEAAEAAAKEAAAKEEAMGTVDLYEINNAVAAEKPSIKSLSEIVCTYGDYIYYIKNNNELCAYNAKSENETVLDKSAFGYNLGDTNSFGYTFSRDKIYIRKVLKIEAMKQGCFSFINRKKKEEEYKKSIQNNYSMLVVDLAHATMDTAIEKMVGCICVKDFIFFTVSEVVSEDKKHGKTYKNIAKMHNLSAGLTEVLFEKNCEILAVSDTKVIYDFWTPNSLNRQLRVIDYVSKEDLVLEDNIYNFLNIAAGRVFYRVGNKKYSPLFSIKLDGTERTQVLPHYPDSYLKIFRNWIYVRRGNTIIKVSSDGKEKFILASDIAEIVEFAGNNLYYISTGNDFRIARLDGTNNTKIASGIKAEDISVGSQYVYYLRTEWVGGRNASSLYRMDLDGRNVKKMLFNISRMKEKSASAIYVLKKENKTFEIKVGKKEKDKWEETFQISTYYSVDKVSGEMTPILVLGMPDAENYKSTAKGCALFKKKVQNPEITEVFPEIDYGQITEEGGEAIFANALAALQAKADNGSTPSAGKNTNNGCSGCSKGCASLFAKKN